MNPKNKEELKKAGLPEEIVTPGIEEVPKAESGWKPRTRLGLKVKHSEITDIEDIFKSGERIQEQEIVNILLPDLEEDLLLIGQAKGKFGGGQRRIFKQTQKKTKEGNKIHFLTCSAVGNRNGYVGVNVGKSKETVPSRDKSKRNARLELIRIRRGCGSWECNCHQPHSIPFAITGKCGSAKITLLPAPKGKGLCVEKECARVLALAGVKDVWSKTSGQTGVKLNLIKALVNALKKLSQMKIKPSDVVSLGIIEGKLKESGPDAAKVAEIAEVKEIVLSAGIVPPVEPASEKIKPQSKAPEAEE